MPRTKNLTQALLATILVAFQLTLALSFAGGDSLAIRWQKLFAWDSYWYNDIASNGYRNTLPMQLGGFSWDARVSNSNVAFFPGFPLLTSAVASLTGIESKLSQRLVALCAAGVFWYALLSLFQKLKIPRSIKIIGVLSIILFPTSIFLVLPFSESTFLAAMLIYFAYVAAPTTIRHASIAAISGIVLTASRVMGAPISLFPLLLGFLTAQSPPSVRTRQIIIALFSLQGIFLFFLFCHLSWGYWNLYFITQEIGFGTKSDWHVLFSHKLWQHPIPDIFVPPDKLNPNAISGYMACLYSWILVGTIIFDLGSLRSLPALIRSRGLYYLSATALLIMGIVGMATRDYTSLSRYILPVHIWMVVVWLSLITELLALEKKRSAAAILILMTLLAVGGLVLLPAFIERYANKLWVA